MRTTKWSDSQKQFFCLLHEQMLLMHDAIKKFVDDRAAQYPLISIEYEYEKYHWGSIYAYVKSYDDKRETSEQSVIAEVSSGKFSYISVHRMNQGELDVLANLTADIEENFGLKVTRVLGNEEHTYYASYKIRPRELASVLP